ncbi:CBS domain-containing protein [Funiculus sociatus GB2-A5]|uniref:histidine kinase n=1 Tax=Funiculus sociatus GB2-A5 TaxID=2933946 RepID=A0ABV0JTU6_9CYAN|nr:MULTISPECIES: CBS domain-containing protein [unclassified Trichocoleus]MBD1908963.1 CBS domain-containing protein [Trichocoleus sp. FACHB-832]MBD2062997.1 CBS domain-containing protein [Trichocoleus sp. FACHB-6]
MHLNGLPIPSLSLEPAIERQPLTVAPDTLLVDVLALMSQLRSSCVLPNRIETDANDVSKDLIGRNYQRSVASSTSVFPERESVLDTADSSGCYVLVIEGTQLVGVFTERDIVRLTAAGTSLINVKIGDIVTKTAITLRKSEAQDVFTALSLFRQHRIRHLPIMDDNDQIVGVVTNDSIRKALQPVNLLTRLRYVSDVMTSKVVHAPLTASVLDLAQLMAQQLVSCVVITQQGQGAGDKGLGKSPCNSQSPIPNPQPLVPVGIVTERDVVQFQALELDLSKTQAQDVMSTPLFCLRPSDSLWDAHQEMQRRRVRRLVVSSDRGQLLGIVSQTSLLQVLNPADMYNVIEVLQQAVEERTTALRNSNERLRSEIAERKRAEKALQQAHDDLKIQIEEQTAELNKANALLKQDIIERVSVEAALRQSEAQLKQQAQHLQQTLDKLQKTQAQLIQTEKMSSLGQLVAGVAHEINNPINFIYGNLNYADKYVQDLLKLLQLFSKHYPQPTSDIQRLTEEIDLDFLSTDLPKLLASMKVGANRIRDLVLSLRNFSRLDESLLKSVNIHEGLDSTLLILQNQLEARTGRFGIRVIKEYGNLPLVECLGGQLNQVFMNILSNAIDALKMRSGEFEIPSGDKGRWEIKDGEESTNYQLPTIRIRTEVVDKNQVAICIADNGIGMTEAISRQMFDPFFTTKPVGKGTGLGLSISYQIIVEKHGGQLQCNSALGHGTEFIIQIPIRQQSHVKPVYPNRRLKPTIERNETQKIHENECVCEGLKRQN